MRSGAILRTLQKKTTESFTVLNMRSCMRQDSVRMSQGWFLSGEEKQFVDFVLARQSRGMRSSVGEVGCLGEGLAGGCSWSHTALVLGGCSSSWMSAIARRDTASFLSEL